MSFLERKSTQWTFAKEENKLQLSDKAKTYGLLMLFVGLGSFQFLTVLFSDGWSWISIFITALVYIPIAIAIGTALKTTSFKKVIDLEQINAIVLKGEEWERVYIQLLDNRYRQLYFNSKKDFNDFVDFCHNNELVIEQRKSFFSLPLNY